MINDKLICKCCGKQARWCDEDIHHVHDLCDEIHCDHCGIHYSCENKAMYEVETIEECKEIMLRIYNGE